MFPELSVVIINFNGSTYLKGCLDSLTQNLGGIAYEIIVVDNNSQDESCSFIKANYPEVVLIESKVNLGFSKGNNEAVKVASGAYILFLNNDTVVLDNLLPVLNYLKSDVKIGAVGIKMIDSNWNYLPSAGNFPSCSSMFKMEKLLDRGAEFKNGNFSKSGYEVDWLSGSFLLVSTVVFNAIKGFDEDYFLYVEDVDFSKKLSNSGYKRVFLPQFKYQHFVGFNKSKNHLLVKGYETYISKHFIGVHKIGMLMVLQLNKLVKKVKATFIQY